MNERNLILLGLGVVTAYDIITTITGTMSILGPNFGSTIGAILLGLIIGGLLCYSYEIVTNKSDDFMIFVLKGVWGIALAYDLYTSFMGNNSFIIQTELSAASIGQIVILIGLTFFVSGCPIILSYLRNNERFMTGEK